MSQNTLLEGLRSQILDSIKGRKFGLDVNSDLVVRSVRQPVMGTTGGTTILSTASATLPAYGVSMVGSSGTSGATSYVLDAPIPGVRKTIFNPTTGTVVLGTTAAGAFICSTGSATSTYGYATFAGKGNILEMIGLTTALWGVVTNYGISTVTTGNTVSFV